jgi:hypothetical protein
MGARLLINERQAISDDSFVEMVIWLLPKSAKGKLHRLKYRLAFIANGQFVLRYDNETAKGDHRHIGDTEEVYSFTDIDTLIDNFLDDVDDWRQRDG